MLLLRTPLNLCGLVFFHQISVSLEPEEGEWKIGLYKEPNQSSARVGDLVVRFKLKKGFSLLFEPSSTDKAVSFTPDLLDRDWGYGPYFHLTALAEKDGWVLFPRHPFPSKVWGNIGEAIKNYDRKFLEKGVIYKFGDRSIVVLKLNHDSIVFRDEQPRDMWCKDNRPPLKDYKEETVSHNDLYDTNQHLILKIKYTRGC